MDDQTQRFWISQRDIDLVANTGLLPKRYGKYQELQALESLRDEHLIVLLGDPGTGKSTEITRFAERERTRIGDDKLLRLCSTARDGWLVVRSVPALLRYWFDSQKYHQWKDSHEPLFVLLDGLDEIHRDDPNAGHTISNELATLSEAQRSRIFVRVTCRTNEWNDSISAAKTYLLAPPLESDLVQYASQRGVDGAKLVDELKDTALWPFSSRPIIWDWLIDEAHRDSLRSKSLDQILWKGMQKLCTEEDPSRQTTEPEHLRTIAARIGYVSLLSGKSIVWTGTDLANIPDDSLKVSELYGGTEETSIGDTSVSRETVLETVRTGLFISHGQHTSSYSHQTYQEFLAAHYCVQKEISSDQVLSVIRNPQDHAGKVLDRYWQFAGWLAQADSSFFEILCQFDPETLVQSDAILPTSEAKDVLLKSYLDSIESGRIVRTDWYNRKKFRKFAHPSIGKLATSYIDNKALSQESRQTAIYVVEACASAEVAPILAQVAMNQSEPEPLRRSAAHVISVLDNDDAKLLIKPLIYSSTFESADELRGYAFQANWPVRIKTRELFAAITPPGSALQGAYKQFLRHHLVEHLPVEDLPLAITWIEAQAEVDWGEFQYDLNRVHEEIVAKAWDGVTIPEVRHALVAHIARRIESGDSIFGYREELLTTSGERVWSRELVDDLDRRRLFLEHLIPEVGKNEADKRIRLLREAGLLKLEDAHWHEERLLGNSDTELDEILAKLVIVTADIKNLDRLWRLREHDRVGNIFNSQFEAIALNSQEAERQKLLYSVFEAPPERDPDYNSRIEDWNTKTAERFQKLEKGDNWAWCSIDYALQNHPDSVSSHSPSLDTDIREFGGWQRLRQDARDLLVQRAQRFLSNWTPDPSYIGTDTDIPGNLSGVRALTLLAFEAPQALQALEPVIWQQWGPAILGFPPRNNSEITPNLSTLLKHAIENGYDPNADLDLIARNDTSGSGYYF